MKINIVLYNLYYGGVEKTAVDLANELVQKGNEVEIVVLYKFNPEIFEIDKRIKLKNIFGFSFKGFTKLLSLLPGKLLYKFMMPRNGDIDIAYQALLPTKIVSGSSNLTYAWIHGLGIGSLKDYRQMDEIIFVGQDIMGHYVDEMPKEPKKGVLYNAMNFDVIDQRSRADIEGYVANEKYVVLTVGRLSAEKRFDRLLESFSDFAKNKDDVELWFVGDGPEKQSLVKIAEKLNLSNKVVFWGFDPNPYRFMSKADVYVCSSDYEGLNVAISEASYLGLPIISTNVYGAREIIVDKNIGTIIDKSRAELSDTLDVYYNLEDMEDLKLIRKNKINQKFVVERQAQFDKLFKNQ